MLRSLKTIVTALLLALPSVAPAQSTEFARLAARLSEPGGFFDTDNLVSNETSYLHVLGGLREQRVKGGAYIGVGPEQSFSYIAEIEPEIAILIDIRRDNALLHLLFKAMFEAADNRLSYLGLLFGRPVPADVNAWRQRDLFALLAHIDRTPLDTALHARNHQMLMARVERFGIPLDTRDRQTIRRFHDEFAAAGLGLTFTSLGGRIPRRAYPTVRQLYTETDLEGNQAGYLASDERWQRVRRLQRSGRVVPVVGDLAGPQAMKSIGAYLRETGRTVSAFYVSNVEMYLFRAGTFPAFALNVRALPTRPSSVLIRSWFSRGVSLPATLPGHFSTQLLQPFSRFLAVTARPDTVSYWTVVTDGMPVPASVEPLRR
jgi:hypothetical protein